MRESVTSLLSGSALNPLIYLVAYGSSRASSDLDLLAVYAYPLDRIDYGIGKLDIFAIDSRTFERLVALHDIIVTEPILTGDLWFGDISEWANVKRGLLGCHPTRESLYHLLMRTVQVMSSAECFVDRFEATGNQTDAFSALKNLSFALGYVAFIHEYRRREYPVTLRDIVAQFPLLFEVTEKKSQCAKGAMCVAREDLRAVLSKAKSLCMAEVTK